MKDILSVLLFLGICILPSIIKVVKEDKSPQPKKGKRVVKTPPPFQFEQEDEEGKFDAEMQKKESKVPKEQEYFTYETLDDDLPGKRDLRENKEKLDLQSVENEKESVPELTMSEEEIYKGFIYSEILKRKYN